MIELLENDIYFIKKKIYIYYKCILLHNLLAKRITKIYRRDAERSRIIRRWSHHSETAAASFYFILLYLEHL